VSESEFESVSELFFGFGFSQKIRIISDSDPQHCRPLFHTYLLYSIVPVPYYGDSYTKIVEAEVLWIRNSFVYDPDPIFRFSLRVLTTAQDPT
jgi:hypothetical protein